MKCEPVKTSDFTYTPRYFVYITLVCIHDYLFKTQQTLCVMASHITDRKIQKLFFLTCSYINSIPPIPSGPGVHPASYPMGTESFLRGRRPRRGVDHPPSSAEVTERIELYLHCPSRPSWPFLRWILPFTKVTDLENVYVSKHTQFV
jgi:hypothetical protein